MAKVLVIEDDPALAESVSDLLEADGHKPEIVYDGQLGLDHILLAGYDLAIVDWQLPGLSGPDICAKYRASGGKIPILMLTQRSTVLDKETGLDAGADDYLPKPFDAKELNARIRALLRRSSGFFHSTQGAGSLLLDSGACTISFEGRTVKLLPREFSLVEFLMRHPESYFTADQLLKHVWESSAEVSSEALRTCISRVRTKVDKPGQPSIIETSRGWGYKISEHFLHRQQG